MRTALLASTALALSASALSAQTPFRVGERLPDLHLPTIDGKRTIDLAEFRGKRLLLIEFAAW